MSTEDFREVAKRIAATAPPLTPERRARLAALLRPTPSSTETAIIRKGKAA